jgi:hypothetical protein
MTKAGKWKWGLGIGCGLAVLLFVGAVGVATWYATSINAEYKAVRDSEERLIAATEGPGGYSAPQGGIPAPARIEIFLDVRRDLQPWLANLAAANEQFLADREKQKTGGVKEFVKLFGTGSDLMPVYAGFWTARNEALLEHGMGPGEYVYIYSLVYRTWLGLGRRGSPAEAYPTGTLSAALEPYRARLLEAHVPEVELLELIFEKDEPTR